VQPPLAYVGCTEEEALEQYAGEIDVFVSKFKPMKNTVSGRDERTFMKLLVHVASDQVPRSFPARSLHREHLRWHHLSCMLKDQLRLLPHSEWVVLHCAAAAASARPVASHLRQDAVPCGHLRRQRRSRTATGWLQVLGAHMVGPDSAEIMQGIAIALKAGAKKVLLSPFQSSSSSWLQSACMHARKTKGMMAHVTCLKGILMLQIHFDSTVGIHPTAAEEWVCSCEALFVLMSVCSTHLSMFFSILKGALCRSDAAALQVSMRTRARRIVGKGSKTP
jgi:hypothetical protein